jgi:SPP1 family predicted phage head-tail adaptor
MPQADNIAQSGKLRYLVSIEQQASTRDAFGAEQDNWTTFAQVYAGFETLSGRELEAAQKINAEITSKITIRWRAGILPEMRVNWSDTANNRIRIFDILAPMDPTEHRRQLNLLSVERFIPGVAAAGPANGLPSGWGRKSFNEAPDGVRMVFTLPGIPLPSVIQNVVGGQIQGPLHYLLAGNQVTFDFAPKADDEMFAWY